MCPMAKGTVSLLLSEVFKTPSRRSAWAFGPYWGRERGEMTSTAQSFAALELSHVGLGLEALGASVVLIAFLPCCTCVPADLGPCTSFPCLSLLVCTESLTQHAWPSTQHMVRCSSKSPRRIDNLLKGACLGTGPGIHTACHWSQALLTL